MMDKTELAILVRQAKTGDAEAFSALYTEAFNSVYYVALKMLRNEHTAEEIAQEVFLFVYQNIGELKEDEKFFGWVHQITAYKCKNQIRKKTEVLYSPVSDDDGDVSFPDIEDDSKARPEESLISEDIKQIILSIIDKLSDDQRAVVLMFYFQELPIRTIAEIMETNENTIKSRLSYARKQIRQGVEEEEKVSGIRLHSISALFLIEILSKDAILSAPSLATQATILQGVTQAAGITGATVASGGTAAGAATAGATTTAGATGAGIGAKIGITAVSLLVAGGIGTGIFFSMQNADNAPSSEVPSIISTSIISSVIEPPARDPRLSDKPALDFTMTLPHTASSGFDDLAQLEQIAGPPGTSTGIIGPAEHGWSYESFSYGVTFYTNPHTGNQDPEASEIDYTRGYGPNDEYRWTQIFCDKYSLFGIDLSMSYTEMKSAMEATFETGIFDLSRSHIYDDEPDVFLSYELYFPGQDEILELSIHFDDQNVSLQPVIVARMNYTPFIKAYRGEN